MTFLCSYLQRYWKAFDVGTWKANCSIHTYWCQLYSLQCLARRDRDWKTTCPGLDPLHTHTHTHTHPSSSLPPSVQSSGNKPLLVQKAHCLHFTHQWILCSKKAVKIRALLSLAFPISTFNGCGGLQCTPAVPGTVAGTSCRDFPCTSWCIKPLSCLALHKDGCSPLRALCNHSLVLPFLSSFVWPVCQSPRKKNTSHSSSRPERAVRKGHVRVTQLLWMLDFWLLHLWMMGTN